MATDSNSRKSLNVDMEEVKKIFELFDANGDGKISSEELAGVIEALGTNTSAEEVARMMEEIDTDRDGFVNLEEFASFYGSGDAGTKEVHDAFELYDQDHDGFISVGELHQILTRLGERCSVEDCEVMIKSVDSDKDGKVSFDEFKIMMTSSKKAEA